MGRQLVTNVGYDKREGSIDGRNDLLIKVDLGNPKNFKQYFLVHKISYK